VDVTPVEGDLRQAEVFAQAVEPARLVGQQRQPRALGALGGGDEVDLGGHEGVVMAYGQRMQRFGDDLGRQAGDGKQDAAGKEAGRRLSMGAAKNEVWRCL
jgi:hypothetical protein